MITGEKIRQWEIEYREKIKSGPIPFTRLSWLAYKFNKTIKQRECHTEYVRNKKKEAL
jgi:hypothetical protein